MNKRKKHKEKVKKAIIFLLKGIFLILILQNCVSAPERVDERLIISPEKMDELREMERGIVSIHHSQTAQVEREKEFYQKYRETLEKYQNSEKQQRKFMEKEIEASEQKWKIETVKREIEEARMIEAIAKIEWRKAVIVAANAHEPVDVSPYEKYYNRTKEKVARKKNQLQKMEERYRETMTQGDRGGSDEN